MPVHDWTRVDAGIFHDFHHAWIEELKRALNGGLLPDDYYALAEQYTGRFGPDVLTLKGPPNGDEEKAAAPRPPAASGSPRLLLSPPKIQVTAETDLEFYRRKESRIAVRHVSGDDLIAVIEILSWGNKNGAKPWRRFLDKTEELLANGIHLLLVDVYPPTSRDPQGVHGAIWADMTEEDYQRPSDQPLTLASYEADPTLRAYVTHMRVGATLVDMPLFLRPGAHVPVPLEATYQTAFAAVPRRWRAVLEAAHS